MEFIYFMELIFLSVNEIERMWIYFSFFVAVPPLAEYEPNIFVHLETLESGNWSQNKMQDI